MFNCTLTIFTWFTNECTAWIIDLLVLVQDAHGQEHDEGGYPSKNHGLNRGSDKIIVNFADPQEKNWVWIQRFRDSKIS